MMAGFANKAVVHLFWRSTAVPCPILRWCITCLEQGMGCKHFGFVLFFFSVSEGVQNYPSLKERLVLIAITSTKLSRHGGGVSRACWVQVASFFHWYDSY